ncbi:hypothetical protein [Roseateles sp.]|uniref:hypothetical protein n=1 Tax=Roseateles sp. TaxID=1971397 RepID=UPI002DFFDB9B|nr:hypothetical protein [Roseateles sp.]
MDEKFGSADIDLFTQPGSQAEHSTPPSKVDAALPTKRAKLHARRFPHLTSAWRAGLSLKAGGPGGHLLTSRDGTLAIAIRSTPVGLWVERRHCPLSGPRTAHTLIFESPATFDKWCAAEPLRFDDPILYDALRREGHEAFGEPG